MVAFVFVQSSLFGGCVLFVGMQSSGRVRRGLLGLIDVILKPCFDVDVSAASRSGISVLLPLGFSAIFWTADGILRGDTWRDSQAIIPMIPLMPGCCILLSPILLVCASCVKV